MSMTYEYTVKVYADAVKGGMRTLESVPEEYRKDVEYYVSNGKFSRQFVDSGF